MFGQNFLDNAAYIPIQAHDFNGAADDSIIVSMKNYGHATVIVGFGESAGASMAVTLRQAQDTAGTGDKALTFTNMRSTGQKLYFTGRSAVNFVVGETLTQTSGNSNTAEIYAVSDDYLLVRCLTNGTTWGNGNTITGGTSGATAAMNGTGQDEDMLLEIYTAPSSTFTVPTETFKTYAVEVDADSLDIANGFDHLQVACANPGTAAIGSGCIILTQPRHRGVPMPSVVGAIKMSTTNA